LTSAPFQLHPQKAVRTAEIKERLAEIDFESIRPLRAKVDGNPTGG